MIWFGLVWFYDLSTIVDYFMPNPLYTHTHKYIYIYIYMIWLGLAYLSHCRLFNAKSSSYEVHTISFQTFFVWALLLIVRT